MLDVTVSAEESLKVVGCSVEWEIQDVEIAQSTIAIRPHWYAAIEDQDRDGGSYEAMEALTRCRKGAREATNGNKDWTCRLGTGEGEGASEGTGRPKLRLPPCIAKKGLVATHTCNLAQLRPAWPCVWHIALPVVADSFARRSLRNRASQTSGCCSGQRCCLELRSFARWLRRESTSLAKTSNCERRTMTAEETENFPWPGLVPRITCGSSSRILSAGTGHAIANVVVEPCAIRTGHDSPEQKVTKDWTRHCEQGRSGTAKLHKISQC
ncbi:hypothetical protein L1887_48461 [Cichorium endivia]|nr:hypothetical protein L1887_48461 [Cichorium endivia]